MIKKISKAFEHLEADIEAVARKPKQLLSLGFYKYTLPLLLMGAMGQVRAQEIELDEALTEAQTAAFSVFDWAFIIIIAVIFLVGATGLTFGLIKVFSGRPSEGVVSLIVGIIAIVLVAVLVGVFFSLYQDTVSSIEGT